MKPEPLLEGNGYQNLPFRIIVADDNDQVLDLVSRILSSPKYSLALGTNGIEALNEFRSRPADLVITDFDMPYMNGIDLASHVKSLSPSTPVILMTGSDAETVREKALGNGIDHFLFKPFSPKDLKVIVEAFCWSSLHWPPGNF